jgi:hypothetical protein
LASPNEDIQLSTVSPDGTFTGRATPSRLSTRSTATSSRPGRLPKLVNGLFYGRLLQRIERAHRHPARGFGDF